MNQNADSIADLRAQGAVFLSYNPKVSMDPAVYYKTQASMYERLALGTGKSPRNPHDSNLPVKRTRAESKERRVKKLLGDLLNM